MGIRIRPEEIEVPKQDPFKNDLLNRKEPAEALTNLVDSIEGPCVLAVDAPWGAGKTTFLRIWSRHLRNSGFPVVRFNAWETDHAGDAFVALVSELTEQLRNNEQEPIKEKVRLTKEAAKNVAVRAIPVVLRILTSGVLNIDPDTEKELGKLLADYAVDGIKEYEKARKSIKGFRSRLQGMANTLHCCHSHPLVVMIDELDRCRPSYAIELIEVAKHLFGVDHIVFVLAVNREQLTHSIKALYGSDFDGGGYLRRFFDVDFRLPDPDRSDFIREQLKGMLRNGDQSYLQAFFSASNLSLRQVAQAIHRFRLVVASFDGKSDLIDIAESALVLRAIDPEVYRRFVGGSATDEEAVDAVFERIEIVKDKKHNHENMYIFASFEGIMVMCYKERESANRAGETDTVIESPLISRYRELTASERPERAQRTPDIHYATAVAEAVEHYSTGRRRYRPIGFREAVRRIELLARIDVG